MKNSMTYLHSNDKKKEPLGSHLSYKAVPTRAPRLNQSFRGAQSCSPRFMVIDIPHNPEPNQFNCLSTYPTIPHPQTHIQNPPQSPPKTLHIHSVPDPSRYLNQPKTPSHRVLSGETPNSVSQRWGRNTCRIKTIPIRSKQSPNEEAKKRRAGPSWILIIASP
jgi:hypothetical protein